MAVRRELADRILSECTGGGRTSEPQAGAKSVGAEPASLSALSQIQEGMEASPPTERPQERETAYLDLQPHPCPP